MQSDLKNYKPNFTATSNHPNPTTTVILNQTKWQPNDPIPSFKPQLSLNMNDCKTNGFNENHQESPGLLSRQITSNAKSTNIPEGECKLNYVHDHWNSLNSSVSQKFWTIEKKVLLQSMLGWLLEYLLMKVFVFINPNPCLCVCGYEATVINRSIREMRMIKTMS